MKTKIGIIGQGFVGSAVKEGMKNHFNILAYDKDPSKYSNSQGVENIVKQCEILFVCVPTPMRKSGECDLSILNLALQEINDYCISNIKDINCLKTIKLIISRNNRALFKIIHENSRNSYII